MSVEVLSNPIEELSRKKRLSEDIDTLQTAIEESFSKEDLIEVEKAKELMLKLHLQQKDRADGNPFAKHPIDVASRVLEIYPKPSKELFIAALLHDSVEDKAEVLFTDRANRKFKNKNYNLKIRDEIKEKYWSVFKDWSFREIKEKFGDKVEYFLRNLTNHDFDSLAEDLGLEGEEKIEFKNKAYLSHVQEIIEDPDLCLLKYADFSVNIDLRSLPKDSLKYKKLKRKYKSVIPIFIDRLNNISESHELYGKKDQLISNLQLIYQTQYLEN